MSDNSLYSMKNHRLKIAFLLCFCLFATGSMRLNLGFATVCMVNSTAFEKPISNFSQTNKLTEGCTSQEWNAKAGYNGSLLWTPSQQSLIMSGTFYGGMVTIWISGYLADRFGPKMLLLVASLDYVVISLLSPYLAETSYSIFFASRIVMGLGEGFILPCINSVAAKWFPSTEKSTVAAIYTSGNQLAAAFTPVISSFLCSSSLQWPSIFYAYGVFGLIFCIVFFIFTSNTPQDNSFIREEEREFLGEHVQLKAGLPKGVEMPWSKLLFDSSVLAPYFCTWADMICVIVMQAFLPLYMKEVLRLPIHQNGFYTMLPFICQMIGKNTFAPISDHLKKTGRLSLTSSVRIFQGISCIGASLCLIMLAFIPNCHRPYTALPILALYGVVYSACTCGYFTAMLCVAPAYSGTVASFSRTYGTVGNLFGSNMVGLLAHLDPSYKWPIVFCVTAFFKLLSLVFFLYYGTAEVQDWAKLPEKKEKLEEISSTAAC